MHHLLFALLTALSMQMPSYGQSFFQEAKNTYYPKITGICLTALVPNESTNQKIWLSSIRNMLKSQAPALSEGVIQKAIKALKCTNQYDINHKPILTVIDYSLPSSQKRLWVFDLNQKKLLFHTYVSHGIRSGIMNSDYFSNEHNSKSSSLGVFLTKQSYYGRHGLAMRLRGLEAGFNDHADGRAIVMHGGWYMEEPFVKKYGRPGRSWGCPAIPKSLTRSLIQTIKDDGILIAYYPSEQWLVKSKYLHCGKYSPRPIKEKIISNLQEPLEDRSEILFVEKNKNNQWDRFEPIVTIRANDYINTFKTKAPLKRMLRRQINKEEYIALNSQELRTILNQNPEKITSSPKALQTVYFVIPHIKTHHGRYLGTDLKIVSLGHIKEITAANNIENPLSNAKYSVHFEKRPNLQLQSTNAFIRWIGL